jgi:Protein of unknown function (DUF4065)
MHLDFNLEKAIASAAVLLEKQGGEDSMFALVKKLYYADRTALMSWGNSITGDELVSMKKGPVVSIIYDLLKNKGDADYRARWNEVFERSGNTVTLKIQPKIGVLSAREKQTLEKSRRTIDGIQGEPISTWLHKNCPEWEDPGDSSYPIYPETILKLANKTNEEIRSLEEANEEIRSLHRLLSSR